MASGPPPPFSQALTGSRGRAQPLSLGPEVHWRPRREIQSPDAARTRGSLPSHVNLFSFSNNNNNKILGHPGLAEVRLIPSTAGQTSTKYPHCGRSHPSFRRLRQSRRERKEIKERKKKKILGKRTFLSRPGKSLWRVPPSTEPTSGSLRGGLGLGAETRRLPCRAAGAGPEKGPPRAGPGPSALRALSAGSSLGSDAAQESPAEVGSDLLYYDCSLPLRAHSGLRSYSPLQA